MAFDVNHLFVAEMRMRSKSILLLMLLFAVSTGACGSADGEQATYCNPINLDYGYCPAPNQVEQGKHRSTADPAIVVFRGDYYLFSTNQWGYWWSGNLRDWTFVPRKFLKPAHLVLKSGYKVYDDLCAGSVRDG